MPHSRRYNLFALILLACAASPASAQEVPLDAGKVRAAVLAETNAYRASKNIPQLKENAALEAAATAYAIYLAEHEKMGHTADGRNPPKRVSVQGYKGYFISENVWSSFRHSETMLAEELARKAMDGWKRSTGHNANLLQKRAHEIGMRRAGSYASRNGGHAALIAVVKRASARWVVCGRPSVGKDFLKCIS